VQVIHNKLSKAKCSTVKNDTGYTLTALIPLDELPAAAILGMDVVISRSGVKNKESIGDDPGNSFQRRSHYHLFEIPERKIVGNCDFSASDFGDPAWWCYSVRDGVKVNAADGTGVIEVTKPGKNPVCFHQHCKIVPGKFKRATLQVKIKYDDLEAAKPGRGRHGLHIAVNYPGNSTSYGYTKMKKDITGSADWQIIQMDFLVPAKASYLQPHVGVGMNTTGKVSVDGIKLILWEK
jgi:hypothetical protein